MTVHQASTPLVAFKLPPSRRPALIDLLHSLPTICLRDGKSYIGAVRGGKQICDAGFDGGMDLVFTLEFETMDDYDYYLNHDPVHLHIKATVQTEYGVEALVAWGFVPGEY